MDRHCTEGFGAMKNLYIFWFTQLYEHFGYSVGLALIIFTVNIIATFTWSFLDLITVIVSYSLSERFQVFNCYLARTILQVIIVCLQHQFA